MTEKVKIKVTYLEKGKTKTKTVYVPEEKWARYEGSKKELGYLRGYLLGYKPIDWEVLS